VSHDFEESWNCFESCFPLTFRQFLLFLSSVKDIYGLSDEPECKDAVRYSPFDVIHCGFRKEVHSQKVSHLKQEEEHCPNETSTSHADHNIVDKDTDVGMDYCVTWKSTNQHPIRLSNHLPPHLN